MDTLTPAERSERMSRVRGKNTKPEMVVRRLAHSMGYRYRLHDRSLPGCPDMVFHSRMTAIFVHGCFWHRHKCAMGDRTPKSRAAFWKGKLEANRTRDRRNTARLRTMGWRVLVVWECETRDIARLSRRLSKFLK
jgi:DNA mismatch endonuclease (patch repair protein)